MKTGKAILALAGLFLLLTVAATACQDEDEGGQATEEQLRETAIEAQRTFLTGEPEEAYAFFSSDYQAKCAFDAFSWQLHATQALFDQFANSEISVGEVRFEGEKAFVQILLEGQDVAAGSEDLPYPYYWVFEDGQWKRTTDNPEPCVLPTPTSLDQ